MMGMVVDIGVNNGINSGISNAVAFGGWAVSADILRDVFDGCGMDVNYIDVNRIMPKLFNADRLRDDWAEVVIDAYRLTDADAPTLIAGWSTGAMFAYAVSRIIPSQKLALISATPCFCRKEDFRFGVRQSAIDQMIGALYRDSSSVLQPFYERCGLEYHSGLIPDYTIDELASGLMFLKQADLRPLIAPSIQPIFYHGKNDQIIPLAASKYFCEQTNGVFMEVDGGHAFFDRTPSPDLSVFAPHGRMF
ncbi:MAG: hypothetical protein LBH93_02295 [Chitinispirillales bacterium]|jgi:hypothetical protein|nr:hypothetical protein [Chitinispirillales bacterium]